MRYLLIILVSLITLSCKKVKTKACMPPEILVIGDIKEISRGEYYTPDRFIVSKDRTRTIDMFHNQEDWVRLRVGDSIKITYTDLCFIENIQILNK